MFDKSLLIRKDFDWDTLKVEEITEFFENLRGGRIKNI